MLTLYGHPFSSYTWKALIPLYANKTSFEFRSVDPGEGAENGAFVAAAHPAGKFPVLVDGKTTIVEATSIVEYLAVHHPGPAPLIPADPAQAVTARMLDQVFDNYVMHNMTRVVVAYIKDGANPDPAESKGARKSCAAPIAGWKTGCSATSCRRTSAWSPAQPRLRCFTPTGSSRSPTVIRGSRACAPNCSRSLRWRDAWMTRGRSAAIFRPVHRIATERGRSRWPTTPSTPIP